MKQQTKRPTAAVGKLYSSTRTKATFLMLGFVRAEEANAHGSLSLNGHTAQGPDGSLTASFGRCSFMNSTAPA